MHCTRWSGFTGSRVVRVKLAAEGHRLGQNSGYQCNQGRVWKKGLIFKRFFAKKEIEGLISKLRI